MTVSVKNIMNEAYCRDISIKTRTSLDIKRRNGDFVGAFPVYGYMKSEENKNLLVPDPYAARVVQDIFRMRLDGTSALRIATTLNDMGVLSPLAYKKNNGFPYAKHGYTDKEDCKWSATTVIRILQDETYTGTLVQGKQGTPHYKIKQMEQRPSSEWIRVPDAHEALIPKQDFELVQRIRRLDTRTSPKKDTVYLFSGILICGCCGARMTRKTNRVKGKEYHYYYCPTGKKHGCANPVMLKESDLVECVKDSLKGYIDNVTCLQAILDGIDQSSINQALANEYASHIAANERQLAQALEFKARLYENLVTGTINKEEYTDYKAKYTRAAENAKEAIRTLKDKLSDVLENRSERNRWISHFTQFSTMETLDRKAVVHMIQSIKVIGKKELEITFTYQDEYQKAIQLIQEKKGNPILLTLPPLEPKRYFQWISRNLHPDNILHWLGGVDTIYRWQEMYNMKVLLLAQKLHVPVVDIRSAFLAQHGYQALLCEDGIHPNRKGHRFIYKTIMQQYHPCLQD